MKTPFVILVLWLIAAMSFAQDITPPDTAIEPLVVSPDSVETETAPDEVATEETPAVTTPAALPSEVVDPVVSDSIPQPSETAVDTPDGTLEPPAVTTPAAPPKEDILAMPPLPESTLLDTVNNTNEPLVDSSDKPSVTNPAAPAPQDTAVLPPGPESIPQPLTDTAENLPPKTAPADMQTSLTTNFIVKNAERNLDFFYTLIKKDSTLLPSAQDLAKILEKANTKRVRLSGQDWAKVTLNVDEVLVGYFWNPGVHKSLGSQVTLGFLLPFEVPRGRTVLLSEQNFLNYNKNRGQSLTFQQAGWTDLPKHILDGNFTDWEGQPPLAEWKKSFVPSVVSREDDKGLTLVSGITNFPTVLGKPRSVKAVLEDDRLWLAVTQWESFVPGKTLAYYFFLERSAEVPCDMTVFIPVKGETGPVWVYRPGSPLPQRAGFYALNGAQLEAHIWDPALKSLIDKGWNRVTVDFSQFLKLNGGYEEYFYATFPVTEKTE